jgi:peptidoglycan/LPS O-acetylase OafA/YrhL
MARLLQPVHGASNLSGAHRSSLAPLTGLRFVAALAVVLDHFWVTFAWWNPATGVPSASAPLPTGWALVIHTGDLGVDCFFVLSGFILAYTYVASDGDLRGTRRAFWVARIARIYPVYLLALALDFVPYLLREHHVAGMLTSAAAQPLLLQAWIPSLDTWNSWDPPSWSLSVEAFFYLLFPFIIIALRRQSKHVLWIVAGLSVAVFAILPVFLIYPVVTWWPNLSWALDQVLYFNPLMRLPEFTLGVVLGLLHVRWHQQATSSRILHTKSVLWDSVLVMIVLLTVGFLFLPRPAHYLPDPLVMPGFGIGIVLLAQQRGVIAKVLSLQPFVWLGEISYSVYILHAPLWAWLAWIGLGVLKLSLPMPVLFLIFLTLVLIAATLSYRFIERPLRAAIRARWAARESQHASAVAANTQEQAQPSTIKLV